MALIGATLVECSIFSAAIQILSREKKIVCMYSKEAKKQWQHNTMYRSFGRHGAGLEIFGAKTTGMSWVGWPHGRHHTGSKGMNRRLKRVEYDK